MADKKVDNIFVAVGMFLLAMRQLEANGIKVNSSIRKATTIASLITSITSEVVQRTPFSDSRVEFLMDPSHGFIQEVANSSPTK